MKSLLFVSLLLLSGCSGPILGPTSPLTAQDAPTPVIRTIEAPPVPVVVPAPIVAVPEPISAPLPPVVVNEPLPPSPCGGPCAAPVDGPGVTPGHEHPSPNAPAPTEGPCGLTPCTPPTHAVDACGLVPCLPCEGAGCALFVVKP
jgi:hypothetical protein